MPNKEIENIIVGCVHQKRDSQKLFYKKYYGLAYSICIRYGNREDDVVEVINDGFLKIFKHIEQFKPNHHNIEISVMAWIKKIMIHTSIDRFRKEKKHSFVSELKDDLPIGQVMVESVIDKLAYTDIIRLIHQLSPVYRTVFNLYVIDGFTHSEIAEQLHISVGTSKSNLSKAKTNIQKMLVTIDKKKYERKIV